MANLYLCGNGGVKGLTLEKIEHYVENATMIGMTTNGFNVYLKNDGVTKLNYSDINIASIGGSETVSISGSTNGSSYADIISFDLETTATSRNVSLIDGSGTPYAYIKITLEHTQSKF